MTEEKEGKKEENLKSKCVIVAISYQHHWQTASKPDPNLLLE
jgi:hypothetical protein